MASVLATGDWRRHGEIAVRQSTRIRWKEGFHARRCNTNHSNRKKYARGCGKVETSCPRPNPIDFARGGPAAAKDHLHNTTSHLKVVVYIRTQRCDGPDCGEVDTVGKLYCGIKHLRKKGPFAPISFLHNMRCWLPPTHSLCAFCVPPPNWDEIGNIHSRF